MTETVYLTLLIDGVAMPTRHLEEVYINDELVWSANTGRSVTALFVGDIVGEKITMSLKFRCLKHSQFKTIKSALPGIGSPYKRVQLIQPNGETIVDFTVYRATVGRDMNNTSFERGEVVYRQISFELIEQ